jgi:hypothetical protein
MNSLKQVMSRELNLRNKAGAFLAMATCPCHVVMLLFLTGGTVLGAWLGFYSDLLYALAAVLFVYGVWTMFHPGRSCPRPSARLRDHSC